MTRKARMSGRPLRTAVSLLALCALPLAAQAQTIGYDSVADGPGAQAPSETAPGSAAPGRGRGRGNGSRTKPITVVPYIEVNQIVTAELSPGDTVLTYTQLAAGVDAAIAGRNNGVAASVRYARNFGWGGRAGNGDSISGVVNGYATVTPGLTVEGGALATRISGDRGGFGTGFGLGGGAGVDGGTTNLYSVYAGPSFATRAGDVNVSANYRAGYTKIDQDFDVRSGVGPAPSLSIGAFDVFDESVVQIADATAGVAPGTILPVGLGVGGSYYQEDISNLDQRVRDMQVRGIVTVPVNRDLQVTGALGYENVEISSRDALRDASGAPVVGRNGRFVTDDSVPRQIAYDVEGLIWDVGVMWRPSRRTSLTARIGRRYGTTSFNGTFTYAPNDRSAFNVLVYDNVAGFGGQVTRLLDQLPDDFEAVRDPISGELRGCVSSLNGNGCLAGALGSIRSATFRARGVAASYTMTLGSLNAGLGVGYDRRKFLAARGTILGASNGIVDENLWLSAFLSGQIDPQSGWAANGYAQWLKSQDLLLDDITTVGASASYYRLLTARLRATAALGIDGTLQNAPLDNFWTASALVGMRYSF